MHHQFDLSTSSDTEVVVLFDQTSNSVPEIRSESETSVDGASELPKVSAEEFSSDQQLERWLSYLLRYGVLSAGALMLVGGILYLIERGTEPANYQFFSEKPAVFRSLEGLATAVLSGNSQGIIHLGLLLLIATPIARVAVSLIAFLLQRDFTYVFVTGLVLTGLIYSFARAYF